MTSCWSTLSAADKAAFNEMTRSGTTMRMRSGSELVDDNKSFVTASVVETVSG